jgi:hypothetical protein
MASEIRVNQIQNRSGLSTVTFSDTGVVISGITTVGILSATSITGNLTGTVNTSGVSTFSSGIVVSAGSTSTPSISPSGDSNTGIFFPSADTVCIGEGGAEALRIDSSGRVGLNTNIASGAFYNRFVINSPDSSCWMSLHSTQTGSVVNSDGIDIGLNGSNQGHFWLRENADLLIATNNTERVRIDSSGRVTAPYQPAFMVRGDESTSKASGSKFSFTKTPGDSKICFDRANNWSDANDRFTAPVAGVYQFAFGLYRQSATSSYFSVTPRVNGSQVSNADTFIFFTAATGETGNSDDGMYGTFYMNLSANDYVELYMRDPGSVSISIYGGHTFFGGHLIG